MVGIYKIVSPTNKVYIGQSWNIENRKSGYKMLTQKKQSKLYNSLKKYGFSSHVFKIIHELPKDIDQNILDQYEILYWSQYKNLSYDMLNIRFPGARGKHSEETKEKMRKPKPEGFGEKISKIQTGSKRPESVLRMLGENNPMKKKNIVEKISGENYYNAKKVAGYDNNGNLISTWNTIKEASIELKISSSGIVRCCKGLRKTTSKYQFKYI